MYCFLSILLKISLICSDVDDFNTYSCNCVSICQFEVTDSMSWMQQYVSNSRFVQICAVFHPERGFSNEGDKFHQYRNTITHLNKAAMQTFVPEKDMSFMKDSVPSKSKYNPVRQYNGSKPDKYGIDFFILANVSS